MKKKIFAIVLCLVMALTSVNFAFATGENTESKAISTVENADESNTEVVIGKTGALKKGISVYKNARLNSMTHVIGWSEEYLATIDEVVEADGVIWYKYHVENTWANLVLKNYPYVKASDFVIGSVPNEEETDTPVTPDEPEIGDNVILEDETVEFNGQGQDMTVDIFAAENAFPEGTVMSVKETTVDEKSVKEAIMDYSSQMDVLGMYPLDISFALNGKEQQPKESVALKLELPKSTVPDGANKVVIVHMGENGPEIIDDKYLVTAADSQSITVRVSSFSSYVAVYVNSKYNSTLMRDVLAGNQKYSIKTFKVDLFDYDGVEFNNAQTGNNFIFRGGGVTGDAGAGDAGINDSGQYAKQGILESELNDGMPVIKYSENVQGDDLFSTEKNHTGKTIYEDVNFEFIYNNQTGWYEYKSAANHAQFNNETNTIELYADTLSPSNNKRSDVDLDSYSAKGNFATPTTASDDRIVLATTALASGRLDPSLTYTGLNLNAADVDQIYIKAKIPANVQTNQFEVFYSDTTSFTAGKSFTVEYTPNGDWIEFMFDTAGLTGTINSLRIDPLDSKPDNKPEGYSVNTNQSYTIEISEISFLLDVDEHYTRGGFYPFSDIVNSYPGNGTNFNYDSWTTLHEGSDITAVASRSVVNGASANVMPREQLHYGTVMEFDFYLPASRTASGEADQEGTADNLRFEFTGDDDLWVFVDGKLALDIGGGHGATYGYIDFTDKQSYVEKAVTVTGYNSHKGDGTEAATADLADALTTPGKHTIKMFYMERCATVSNCFIKFNLPQTPVAPVVVSKTINETVDDYTPAESDPIYNKDYTFEIKVNGNKLTNDPDTAQNEMSYTVYGEGISNADGELRTVDNDSRFTLKHGQYATFNIAEEKDVIVTEIAQNLDIDNYIYEGTKAKLNNGELINGYTLNGRTVAHTSLKYDFINNYEALGDLTITKAGIKPVDLDNDYNKSHSTDKSEEAQSTIFTVTGPNSYSQDIVIYGNESVTIQDLPLGEYTVTEKDSWIWRYDPVNRDSEIELPQTADLKIDRTAVTTFNNIRDHIYWLNGGAYCQNLFSEN